MGRSKVRQELIRNPTSRRATLKKRKAGLLKKLTELSTLCGVVSCAVIYNAHEHEHEHHIWPSPQEAINVLEAFRNLPTKKQDKYMLDQKTFLSKQISKLKDQLDKERAKIRVLEHDQFLKHHLELEGEDLCNLTCSRELIELSHILDQKMAFVTQRIEFINDLKPVRIVTKSKNNK